MTDLLTQFRGELAALCAAVIWAIASYIYLRLGKRLSPLILNLVKSGIAIALNLIALGLLGNLTPNIPISAFGLLFLSGAIGIGLGDTAFFASLNSLGSRRALLMESLAPPLTALLALLFLQEALPPLAWLGIALTLTGVTWVVVEQTPEVAQQPIHPLRGIGFGLLAALGQASGSVMSRAALVDTTVSPLWSTLFRLIGGVGVLIVLLATRRQLWPEFRQLRSTRFLLTLTGASFASTFLAIWLQQTSLKYAAAGIAQSISATSPIFVIPIALWLGEPVSLRAIIGVILALIGIWFFFAQG